MLGALFDLGLDFPAWKARMEGLGISGLRPEIRKVDKHGIASVKFDLHSRQEDVHRGLPEINRMLSSSSLPPLTLERSLRIFTRLAEAEAEIHGIPIDKVHFHELGALDAIVDIAGACLGFEMLGVREFRATPLTFGTGTVEAAHGRLSVPAPATLALSLGFPSVRTGMQGELCTPTGTAIVTTLAVPLSSALVGTVMRVGYGAGTRELPDRANVLRLCLMEPEGGEPGYGTYQLECNLDDMTPELVAFAAERLFHAGCRDVWQEAIVMKKNRSAVKLCALAEADKLEEALGVMAEETSTGGMRWFPVRRLVAGKSVDVVDTSYGKVELKRIVFPGRQPRFSPEYESCRNLALQSGVPLANVYREAVAAAQSMRGGYAEGGTDRR